MLARKGGDARNLGERHDHAVERVLEADDARRAGMQVVAQDHVGGDVFEGEVDTVLGDDGLDGCAGEGRYSDSCERAAAL
ncbi:hypothetical protein NLG97_g7553 [Lecanicillium saksenae]|uniref:Uncharacterized protein n=1 Tax=Lecanicillium saksenae TaxID=468837 RepID=A0ACC1QLG3_9HYPO|nr:hypothetical protein NLG97_g7553 [Lecanicillium saksenae]